MNRSLLAAALLMICTGSLLAHGNKHASEEAASDEVIKEQQDWGIAAAKAEATRTIEVSMNDTMRFIPDALTVSLGETIEFTIRNDGEVMHEFVIGTTENNDEHAELMLRFPNMEHDEPHMAHVAPGETGTIVWTFNRAGTFDFACLIAGHYQAGMVGTITVTAA